MNYYEARDQFQDGDIVFFSGGAKNPIRRAITWFTNSSYYHVGIAFWATIEGQRKLLLAESQPGGYRVVNLGFYKDRDMTVLSCPVPWNKIADEVVSNTGVVGYGFIDLALIGLHEKFGMPITDETDGPGDACSVVVAKILKSAGLKLRTMVSPQRLFDQLISVSPCRLVIYSK